MGIDVISLIIFAFCIVLFVWDKLPMATTAILGCALMVIFGVCKFSVAFGQFSSSTVILTIGVMVIGAAISETGLAATIGNWIVRISKGSEVKLIIGTYLVSAAMSAFLTNGPFPGEQGYQVQEPDYAYRFRLRYRRCKYTRWIYSADDRAGTFGGCWSADVPHF